jgi:hypothetical protein
MPGDPGKKQLPIAVGPSGIGRVRLVDAAEIFSFASIAGRTTVKMAIALEKQEARWSNGRLANPRIFVKCSLGTPTGQNPFNFNVFPPARNDHRRGNEARHRRKRFAAWKIDFAIGENVLLPGRLISLSTKTFCRLED